MSSVLHSRRAFFAVLAGLIGVVVAEGPAAATIGRGPKSGAPPAGRKHPDPRPGVDASRVLPADRVPSDARDVYDRIRQVPQVADGIRCPCGCPEQAGMYSLLSCYEESGMAQHCAVCQGVGELVFRMSREGSSLDAIRAAVDRRNW